MWSEPTAASGMPIEATGVVEAIVAIGVVDAGVAAASGERDEGAPDGRARVRLRRNHTPKITSLRASVLRLTITISLARVAKMRDRRIVSGWFPCGCALGMIFLGAPFPQASAAAVPIEIGGGRIEIVFPEDDSDFPRALTREWVATAAGAVTKYYGRFPVPHVSVRIRAVEGNRIDSGKTFGTRNGGVITVSVGRSTTAARFNSDWLMTHEMVHLAFPSVPDEHHWIEEGLATYVEPIARVQAGNLQARQVWSDLVRDLPQGLPETGDRGLDFTHTWGRTYWGGALFCLLADVEIHRRTANAKGLKDALRGILEAGGTISSDWNLERALRIGDDATGVSVLQELYAQMRSAPHPVDLDQLWRQTRHRTPGRNRHPARRRASR